MHREDDDVTEALDSLFEDEGIDIILNAQVKGASGRSGKSRKSGAFWQALCRRGQRRPFVFRDAARTPQRA
jgi:hypothetical protein